MASGHADFIADASAAIQVIPQIRSQDAKLRPKSDRLCLASSFTPQTPTRSGMRFTQRLAGSANEPDTASVSCEDGS